MKILTKHYLDHPHLNRSVYPLGWNGKMDKHITASQNGGLTELTSLTGSNLPTGAPDPAYEGQTEDEFELLRELKEQRLENQNRHEL